MRLILALGVALAATAPCMRLIRPSRVQPATSRSIPSRKACRIPGRLRFLPDGRMLVTERPGRMRIVASNGQLSPPLAGVPKVFAVSQGGLLDVILDRNFAQNRTIYFSYAEPFDGGARTALARARLECRRGAAACRREGHLSPAWPALTGKPLRRTYRAGHGRQLFLTNGEHFTDRDWRRNSTMTSARSSGSRPTAARPPTIRSSESRRTCRKSGPMAIATRKASPSIRPTANCGSRNTAPRAATRSTLSRKDTTTAGRWSVTASITTAHRSAPARRQCRASTIRSGTGRRRSRRPAWPFIPAISSPAGKAACSTAR